MAWPHVFGSLAAGNQPASYLDDNFNAISTSGGSALLGFLQAGGGAVGSTVQDTIRNLPWVNVIDFMSPADRVLLLNGAQVDVTDALKAAALTRKVIVGPRAVYEISSPVEIRSDMQFAGMSADFSKFVLTGTGQLIVDFPRIHWSGMWIQSAVDNLTFIRVTQSYFKFDNFVLHNGGGTGQVGVLMDTDAGGNGYCRFSNYLMNSIATQFKTTGSSYCNANHFGDVGDSWQGFTTAIDVQNTGGFQVNQIAGYFETSINPSQLLKAAAGVTVQDNTFYVHIDAGGGATCYTVNNAGGGTVGTNTWVGFLSPDLWLETGTVLSQIFTDKIVVRAYLSADQTGIVDATYTKIAFNTVSINNSGLTPFAANKFTATRSARVKVYVKATCGQNVAAADSVQLAIYVNGVVSSSCANVFVGTGGQDVAIEDTLSLSKGDYIEAFVKITHGSLTHTVAGGIGASYICINEI